MDPVLPVPRAVAPPQLGCLELSTSCPGFSSFPSVPWICLGGHQREEEGSPHSQGPPDSPLPLWVLPRMSVSQGCGDLGLGPLNLFLVRPLCLLCDLGRVLSFLCGISHQSNCLPYGPMLLKRDSRASNWGLFLNSKSWKGRTRCFIHSLFSLLLPSPSSLEGGSHKAQRREVTCSGHPGS